MAFPMGNGVLRMIYEERNRTDMGKMAGVFRGALLLAFAAPGFLMGKNTTRECMKDDDIRLFLGNTLLYEIMPASHAEKSAAETTAGGVCGALENAGGGLDMNASFSMALSSLDDTLEIMSRYLEDNGFLPWGLTFGFASLIMTLSGARRHRPSGEEKDGQGEACDYYELVREEGPFRTDLGEDVLSAFSRLACDMSGESLAYAALADVEIWGRDLRDIPGLEETVAEHLRDLQMLGVREAMILNGKRAREASGL